MPGLTVMLAQDGQGKKKKKPKNDARLVTTHELWEKLLAPFEGWLG